MGGRSSSKCIPFTISGLPLVVMLLVAGFPVQPIASSASPVATSPAPPPELANVSGLSVEIFDMFNVPYREWWDYREIYGDFPITATCFSFDAIPGGPGSPNPNGSGACDLGPPGYSGETWVTYPYINVLAWANDRKDIQIYAPYRLRVAGMEQPGATLAQPVYLPVLQPNEAPGATLKVRWDLDYITKAESQEIDDRCGSSSSFGFDGFIARSFIDVTLDLQASRRIFGVVATNPAEAQAWWAANSDPHCALKIGVERQWESFMVAQGGSSLTIGVYDLASSWEWFYQPFMTNFVVSVDPSTGETTIAIDHVAWGTEVLLARYFHWGSTLYLDPGPDGRTNTADDIINAEIYPHNPAGWWKWELAWFEDLHFDTTIGATSQSFVFSTIMQFHLTAYANPGADGIYHSLGPDLMSGTADDVASADDIAEWLWMPVLTDYIYGGTVLPAHRISELDPYAGPDDLPFTADDLRYYYGRPGQIYFGTQYTYDLVPAEWDLAAGDTVVVRAPTGDVRCIDPYSPLTSSRDGSDLVVFGCRVGFFKSTPELPAGSSAMDSNGDGLLDTVTLVGPIDWGAPGQPRWGSPALEFSPSAPGPRVTAFFVARHDRMTVDFDASGSFTTGDQPLATYRWDFGDGTFGMGVRVSHTYASPGRYAVRLTVEDAVGNSAVAARYVSPADATVDILVDQMFEAGCPYADYWTLRYITGAQLLQTQVPCSHFWPWVLDSYGDPEINPSFVFTQYRFDARIRNHLGYDTSKPVILPVFNGGVAPTHDSYIGVNLTLDYIGPEILTRFRGTPWEIPEGFGDGWATLLRGTLTMDLTMSKRIFGVVSNTPEEAQRWWWANTRFARLSGAVESQFARWLEENGNGKYDIYNGFEWFFQPDLTDLNATVAPDGTTTVTVFHSGWGYDALWMRWSYWGNASYYKAVCLEGQRNPLTICDATLPYGTIQPEGWMPMESCWCEKATIQGRIASAGLDLDYQAVQTYHLRAWASWGPDRLPKTADDRPTWLFEPMLLDYVPRQGSGQPGASAFPYSELRWYEGLTYIHGTPGSYAYGDPYAYTYVPTRWRLDAGSTLTLVLPRFNVTWYDPVRSRWDPIQQIGQYVMFDAPMTLGLIRPTGDYYLWDDAGKVLSIAGPHDWGRTDVPVEGSPWIEFWPGEVVPPGPEPPVIHSLDYRPRPALVNATVEFFANATDPDGGSIRNYHWDFGDGLSTDTLTGLVTHTYRAVGFYTTTVTVTDDEGQNASASLQVQVVERIPPAGLKILIYGPSMSSPTDSRPQNEATLAILTGHTVAVADTATWSSFTTEDFAAFDAIVFGDPTCGEGTAHLTTANANKATWSAAIDGPIYVQGTDPQWHQFDKPETLPMITSGINFVASGAGTGLYVSLSCYFANVDRGTPVEFLSGIGIFKVGGQEGCPGIVTIVDPAHPAMEGLTDAGLSNWECSPHEFLLDFPASFTGLATAIRPSDGMGLPFIIATSPAPLPPGPPIIVSLDYLPRPAYANRTVQFVASAFDPDRGPLKYRWKFGDGATLDTPTGSATHVYAAVGFYELNLTVTDDEGESTSASILVEVVEFVTQPPVACFGWWPPSPATGTNVSFDASCSYDPDGFIVSFAWDFGDGTTAGGMFVVHTYVAAGTYRVTLRVTDDLGASGSASAAIFVFENKRPVANFSWSPLSPQPFEGVYFNGWSSFDPDGGIVRWSWDFGDGTRFEAPWGDAFHAYTAGGDYLVTLTVFDNFGASGSLTQVLHVNLPPIAQFTTSSPIGKVGTSITFDGTASYDPDGLVVAYFWDFGDGGFAEGPVVSHIYAAPGSYVVVLFVRDDRNATGRVSLGLAVLEPKPPVAILAWSPARPVAGEAVTFDASVSVDPDGSIATYIWQFGDGAVALGVQATHVYVAAGTYQVKLTVIDEDGLADEDAMSLLVVSKPTAGFRTSPSNPSARQVVTFTAAGSRDDRGIALYEWDFGDGGFARGWQVPHAFAQAGAYTVTLTVTNVFGVEAFVSQVVTVSEAVGGRGLVLSSSLEPVEGAQVAIYSEDDLVYETYTDEGGAFVLGSLPDGTYELEISKDGIGEARFELRWTGDGADLGTLILRPAGEEQGWFGIPQEILGGGLLAAAVLAGLAVVRRRRRKDRHDLGKKL